MLNRYAFAILLAVVLLGGAGQWQVAVAQDHRCGTMYHDSLMRAKYPSMGTLQDFEQWLQPRLQHYQQQQQSNKTAQVYTIPVVFHVVYSNPTENISDQQILSQLDVLNEDFRRTNPDTNNTPGPFQPVAVDTEIEFCLAQQDPQGNPHDGINRVSLSGSPFSMNYIDNNIKPSTSWDPNRYFNIWVVNISGGTLGYAVFPGGSGLQGMPGNGGPADEDGIVLNYETVGRPPHNPFNPPYNLGRTATHEVGHWLGLRHVWGDGGCAQDDYCNDTPDSDGANYGCSPAHVSCSSTDMPQNYMDYSDDDCMNLFTADQKARMVTVLLNSPRRQSLTTSTVCQAPTNPPVAAFSGTPNTACPGVTVQFNDNSSNGPTSWSWNFPGGSPGSSTQQNPSVTYNSPGVYDVELIVTNSFGADTLLLPNYINVSGSGNPLPFEEDFESNNFTANGWTVENPDNENGWEIATVGGSTPGDKAAQMDFYTYNNAIGELDRLITPLMDFSGYSSINLEFDHAYRRYNTNSSDSLFVEISTDCGASWTRLLSLGEDGTGSFATQTTNTAFFTPNQADDWCFSGNIGAACFSADLTTYNTESSVQIRFQTYNNYGNNLYLDNINIEGLPTASFTANQTTVCAGEAVDFTSSSTGNVTGYNWTFNGATTSSSTAQNPSGIVWNTPGNYTVELTVTNPSGTNTSTQTNYITVTPGPSVNVTTQDATCGQQDGQATANVTGGSTPYQYSWNTSPPQTSATATGLGAGTYTVTVTDGNNCSVSASGTVANPNAPSLLVSAEDPSCSGTADGEIDAQGSGGTGNLTYSLNGGPTQGTGLFTSLSAGQYTVSVTDQNGCSASETLTLSAGESVFFNNLGIDDIDCNGNSTGLITVNASSTNGVLQYSLNGGPVQNGNAFGGLSAGTYTVTVSNGNGCSADTVVNLSEPPLLELFEGFSINARCEGVDNGSINLNASGGTQPYLFAVDGISNGFGDFDSLAAGNYNAVLTDGNGCNTQLNFTIGYNIELTGTLSSTPDNGSDNGTATVTMDNGATPFTYVWNSTPPQNGPTATGLSSGTYTVTVTDSSGCIFEDDVLVNLVTQVFRLSSGNHVSIYPNPTDGLLELRFELPEARDLQLRLLNPIGQEVLARNWENLQSGTRQLQLHNLAAGVYILQLSDGQTTLNKKLILQQ